MCVDSMTTSRATVYISPLACLLSQNVSRSSHVGLTYQRVKHDNSPGIAYTSEIYTSQRQRSRQHVNYKSRVANTAFSSQTTNI